MSERVFQLAALRIGRTNVGQAMLTIADDALVFVVRADREERALRVPLTSVVKLGSSEAEIALLLQDGTAIHVETIPHLFDEIVARCQSVPELTRTLRSFGSRRGRHVAEADAERVSAAQRRFFAPLLAARRAAIDTQGAAAIVAFDAAALAVALRETIRAFAAERYGEAGPARRALEAELEDLSEPLEIALKELARMGDAAASSVDDLRLWRAWSAQLRATFETADRVWIALDAALGSVPSIS